ncbi:histidine phosphatase family protein [Rhizobium tropici]|uniref:Histidine phosphatase family protein n=1 Tax=Rhizobium tropici TaxID=398 RepID=A0A5B0WFR1_RHITR|nr:phosphoglycerate mutase family protein [Rhizobium tropici]KAA1185672.1 histidine phosphatase family protein [Rhizobium tropici]
MRSISLPLASGILALASLWGSASAAETATQTIVFMRHGEKPEAGLGQLSCQGLNRALALPRVLAKLFGKPTAIFAPDPSKRKDDSGTSYDYIRPLATIEPTAVALGLPVDTSFGYDDTDDLKTELEKPAYAGKLVFVAWEHKQIVKLARQLLSDNGGDDEAVPKWQGEDFDSLYVLRIGGGKAGMGATFEKMAEGLDGRSVTCPTPAK